MDFLKKLTKKQIALIISCFGVIFVSVLVLAMFFSDTNMSPLYEKLSSEDKRAIIFRLNSMGIKFSDEEDAILVPSTDVHDLRMLLAKDGIPSGSARIGYEVFDQGGMLGNSSFINNINLTRALEGELSRTISGLSSVFSARVHLVLPTKEMFSKASTPPSASVMLKLRKRLAKPEVDAIAHLIATAVPDLEIDDVTIIDDKGNPLKTKTSDDSGQLDNTMIEYQSKVESKIKNEVESLLSQYIGDGRVKASVNATIDFNKETFSHEDFDPDRQVIRSQKMANENDISRDTEKAIGVAENISNAPRSEKANSPSKQKQSSNEIINYEISRRVTNKVIQWGGIQRLSVAVIVDGLYDAGENGRTYRARSEEEIRKIKSLVSNAIGIIEERGDKVEVASVPFSEERGYKENTKENFIENKLYVKVLLIISTIIIGALLIMRPFIASAIKRKLTDKPGEKNHDELDRQGIGEKVGAAQQSDVEAAGYRQQSHFERTQGEDEIRSALEETLKNSDSKVISNVLAGWLYGQNKKS